MSEQDQRQPPAADSKSKLSTLADTLEQALAPAGLTTPAFLVGGEGGLVGATGSSAATAPAKKSAGQLVLETMAFELGGWQQLVLRLEKVGDDITGAPLKGAQGAEASPPEPNATKFFPALTTMLKRFRAARERFEADLADLEARF